MKAADMLKESADVLAARDQEYAGRHGPSYLRHGQVMHALFPAGVGLESTGDYVRWGLLNMIVSKLCRYAANFDVGGHDDSLLDITNYAALLREVDADV